MMTIQQAIKQLIAKQDLTEAQMTDVMQTIMTGNATDAQIAGFLVALQMKGETVDEIAAAANVMRSLSDKVTVKAEKTVDTCGTGGDGAGLFNVSTAASFVVAAAGGHVAKHGNRSITSSSGSADLLEAAGVNLDLSHAQVARAIDEIGLGFMFAVKHHGAMKYAITARKDLSVRTIFNILGPLTNPADCKHQVLGVFNKSLIKHLALVLQKLGSRHVLVVHSEEGLDELSIAGKSYVAELKNGEVFEYTVTPEDVGLTSAPIDSLLVEGAEQSLEVVKLALSDSDSTASSMVALNAGAAIYALDIADSLKAGVELAKDVIATGQALEKMQEFIQFTQFVAEASK